MRIFRVLIALALAVIGVIILAISFLLSLLFRGKRKPEVKENVEGERYLGKYEVKRE